MTWVQRISIIIFFLFYYLRWCAYADGERESEGNKGTAHTHIQHSSLLTMKIILNTIPFYIWYHLRFLVFRCGTAKRIVFPHPNRWKFSVSGFENFDYSSESFFYFVKTYLKFKKKSQCFWRFFRKFVQFWLLLQKKDDLNYFCRIHVTVFNALELPFPFVACKINVHCVLIHYTESSLVTYFGKLCKICNNPFPELRRYFWLRWDLERQIN